jgi:xanthine dehydrogenase accessory factor
MATPDLDHGVLRTAVDWQLAGDAVWLVTVARTWGSSPRPPGSLMAIRGDGAVAGSVSGGCIEDDLVRSLREGGAPWRHARVPTVLRYGVSADEAHRFGLPCGGTIELVVERVNAESRLPELLQACLARRSTLRVLDLRTGAVQLRPGAPDGVPHLSETALATHFGPVARLIVIGAGDTAQHLCRFALPLGFEIVVCDPREEYAACWMLEGVTLTREMPDDVILRLRPDRRCAVVALTHDPKLDDLALIDALQSDAFYVGAIGSRRNNALRRERLGTHFGLGEDELARLHGPAGLFIGSRTPAEIALSIMAEVVAAKNGVAARAAETVATGKARVARESSHAA